MINAQYSDPSLTNARLAEACSLSEVYFRKLFGAHFGISPKQFIIDHRLRRASQLLTEARRSISEIAEATGFSNQYHFSRIFKARFGITPSEYRKANTAIDI
jgi:AraC-like DNA-binding protein